MFSFHLKILDETVFSLVGGGEMLEVGVSLSPWILLEKVLGGFTGGTLPAGKTKNADKQEIMDLMMEQRHRQNKK